MLFPDSRPMSVRARHARGEVVTSRTGSRSTLLVGRAREQAILTDLLADALDGHGALVLVGGEAGMGKTALVQAMCAEAVDQHCLVLTGACYDDGATPPFGPWRELAANAAPRNETPTRSTAAESGAPSGYVRG